MSDSSKLGLAWGGERKRAPTIRPHGQLSLGGAAPDLFIMSLKCWGEAPPLLRPNWLLHLLSCPLGGKLQALGSVPFWLLSHHVQLKSGWQEQYSPRGCGPSMGTYWRPGGGAASPGLPSHAAREGAGIQVTSRCSQGYLLTFPGGIENREESAGQSTFATRRGVSELPTSLHLLEGH